MKKNKLNSIILLSSSIGYILLEFISVNNTNIGIKSYYLQTISQLTIKKGKSINGFIIDSPYHYIMSTALLINGIIYLIIMPKLTVNDDYKQNKIIKVLEILTALGSIMVGLFHPLKHQMLLHIIGTFLSFVCGNLTNIFLSKKYNNDILKYLGISGLASAIFLIFIPKYYSPIFERLAVYPIIFGEIFVSINEYKNYELLTTNKYR